MVPAAEWLLDNYHLVEEQDSRDPRRPAAGYYRQLPKLASGLFAGYPRFWASPGLPMSPTPTAISIPRCYAASSRPISRLEPLTIGELWAVAITPAHRTHRELCAGSPTRSPAGRRVASGS